MADKFIHITNGDALTSRLNQLFPGESFITWNEILCEGPATTDVLSEEFIALRTNFLIENFEGSTDRYREFTKQFENIDWPSYEGIVLWFEFDLFCQVNLAAVVHLYKYLVLVLDLHLFLVCSGKIDGTDRLFGLNELNDDQIHNHYKNKVKLTTNEVDLLVDFWNLYTSEDPSKLAAVSFENETLQYLEAAKLAHVTRFPDALSGINYPERMVLEAISENAISNERKLIGHLLRNQGYYGFGDLQWEKVVDKMSPFFTTNGTLCLTSEGEKVLISELNIIDRMKDDTQFGGSLKYDYFYDRTSKKLITA